MMSRCLAVAAFIGGAAAFTAPPATVADGLTQQFALRGDASASILSTRRAAAAEAASSSSRVGVAAVAAAALLGAAAASAGRRRSAAKAVGGASVVFVQPAGAFTGGTSSSVQGLLRGEDAAEDGVAMRALRSCYSLWFKRTTYKPRHRKCLRNRAYVIFMNNKYKNSMKPVTRYLRACEAGDENPASLQEIMTTLKEDLDNACLTIDEVSVQGVLARQIAASRKDKLCRWILRVAIAKGFLEAPKDIFKPAYEVIGYEMPKCFMLREPRPWQLPGWKSPYTLRIEYEMWVAKTKEGA